MELLRSVGEKITHMLVKDALALIPSLGPL